MTDATGAAAAAVAKVGSRGMKIGQKNSDSGSSSQKDAPRYVHLIVAGSNDN